jgi:hypothetical protein
MCIPKVYYNKFKKKSLSLPLAHGVVKTKSDRMREEKREKKTEGAMFCLQHPRAAHTLRSDQHLFQPRKFCYSGSHITYHFPILSVNQPLNTHLEIQNITQMNVVDTEKIQYPSILAFPKYTFKDTIIGNRLPSTDISLVEMKFRLWKKCVRSMKCSILWLN